MALPSLRQRVTQSLLVTSLVFAGGLGYWSVSNYQVPSADATKITEVGTDSSPAQLTLEKSTFQVGEPIKFTLLNTGSNAMVNLMLTSSAPFQISQDDVTVFSPIGAQVITAIRSKESQSWTWNQQNNDGVQVAPGTYTLKVSYSWDEPQAGSGDIKTIYSLKDSGVSTQLTITDKSTSAVGFLKIGLLPTLIGVLLVSAIAAFIIIRQPFKRD